MEKYGFRFLRESRCVVGSKENASRSQFCGLNGPFDIPNNLALGRPWLSELRTIDTTEVVILGVYIRGLYVQLHLWSLLYETVLRQSRCVGTTACSEKPILGR